MSQQRTQKAAGAEPVSRSRAAAKDSGNVASNVQPNQRQRSRSKSNIPKMLRYDLENALVGLCDVWFGEIKPHLVRNNIKLHVHGESTTEEPASGDHRQLPPGAPGCSHFDPGAASDLRRHLYASFVDFCSTQPTASRAQSRRPPAPLCPSQVSSPVKHHTSFNQNPFQSCKPKKRRRRSRREVPLPLPERRVPRLCRTYSLLSHTPRTQPKQRPATEHHLHHHYKYSPLYQRRRPKMINKSTQTQSLRLLELPQTRPHAPPTQHLQNSSAPSGKQQKKRQSIAQQFYFPNDDLRTQEIPQQIRFSDPIAASVRCSGTRTLLPKQKSRQAKHQPLNSQHQDTELRAENVAVQTRAPLGPCPQSQQSNAFLTRKQQKKRQSKPNHSEFAPQDLIMRGGLSQGTASSTACQRCPATTAFFSKHQKRHPQPPPALFQDDLIDIIAEKKDKKLRLLFKSPPRDEMPSIMNLVHSVHARCDPIATKKTPWK